MNFVFEAIRFQFSECFGFNFGLNIGFQNVWVLVSVIGISWRFLGVSGFDFALIASWQFSIG